MVDIRTYWAARWASSPPNFDSSARRTIRDFAIGRHPASTLIFCAQTGADASDLRWPAGQSSVWRAASRQTSSGRTAGYSRCETESGSVSRFGPLCRYSRSIMTVFSVHHKTTYQTTDKTGPASAPVPPARQLRLAIAGLPSEHQSLACGSQMDSRPIRQLPDVGRLSHEVRTAGI